MSGHHVEIVRTSTRFAEVGPAWTRLWQESGASVFQSHAWTDAWLRTSASGRWRTRLNVGVLWRDGDLAAVLPLAVTRRRGLRALEWAGKEHSDYCEVLVRPGDAAAVRAVWSGVTAAGGYDLAYLSHLPPASPTLALGGEIGRLRPSWRREVNLRVRGPWRSGAEWFDGLPKKPRQNHRRGWKALGEMGHAEFRLLGAEEPLSPVLDRLVALKRDWLLRTGQAASILDRDAAPLRAYVDALRTADCLRVFVLELDGRVVAGSVNFKECESLRSFFAAYDPAVEKASAGMLLMAEYIRWAFDHGCHEVDFLCGDEDYKRRFATTELTLAALAGGRTLVGRAAIALDDWLAGNGSSERERAPRRSSERLAADTETGSAAASQA